MAQIVLISAKMAPNNRFERTQGVAPARSGSMIWIDKLFWPAAPPRAAQPHRKAALMRNRGVRVLYGTLPRYL
jgi:hypothetical protein